MFAVIKTVIMKTSIINYRQVSESYFITKPLKLGEFIDILKNLPNDYTAVAVEEILQFNGFNNTPYSTHYPIIEIEVNNDNKEIKFFTKRAKLTLINDEK